MPARRGPPALDDRDLVRHVLVDGVMRDPIHAAFRHDLAGVKLLRDRTLLVVSPTLATDRVRPSSLPRQAPPWSRPASYIQPRRDENLDDAECAELARVLRRL